MDAVNEGMWMVVVSTIRKMVGLGCDGGRRSAVAAPEASS